MSLILDRGLPTEYIFPRNFSMDAMPWMKRISEVELAHQHGTVITSDKKLQSRPLRIWGTLFYSTRPSFREALERLRAACYQDDPTLHASDYWPDKYVILDSLVSFDTTFLVSLRAADLDILFKVTDPFWYAISLTERAWSITAAILARNVANNGHVETYPVITWTAGGTQTLLKIKNNSYGGEEFTYDGGLVIGDILEIDCQKGTVKKNGTSDIHNYSGPFLRLVGGSNSIETTIVGTVGTSKIEISFRARWL